jgi:lysozyme
MSKEISIERIRKELSEEEGVRYAKYPDSKGNTTIGIGHNLNALPVDVIIGRKLGNTKLSDAEITKIFMHDIAQVIQDLDEYIPWWDTLPVFGQYILVTLSFNMGVSKVLEFHDTIAAIKRQAWIVAGTELKDSKWFRQVGNRGPKLVNILRTGRFPDGMSE